MPTNEYKLYIRVSKDFDEEFTEWARRFSITKSQLGNMCVRAGFNAIISAVEPMRKITPEQLVAIMKAAGGNEVLQEAVKEFERKEVAKK